MKYSYLQLPTHNLLLRLFQRFKKKNGTYIHRLLAFALYDTEMPYGDFSINNNWFIAAFNQFHFHVTPLKCTYKLTYK